MERQTPGPDIWKLLRIWTGIGLQSFGGGASTTFLIRRAFIDTHGWLTEEDMQRLWNLSVFTPGINLVALCVLIGRKLGGVWGVILSLAGFLLPSATITCLLTVGFTMVEGIPAIQAILRGVVPATAGIMFLVGLGFARPLSITTYKEGIVKSLLSIAIVIGSILAIVVLKISVIFIVLGAALLGILFFTPRRVALDREA
ncbi:MAG: chromate transporter [Ktedonobacteraceae bacterium]